MLSQGGGSNQDMVKTLVKDLYAKQQEILRLKHEIDAEIQFHESAGGGGGSTPCEGSLIQRGFDKVRNRLFQILYLANKNGGDLYGRFH